MLWLAYAPDVADDVITVKDLIEMYRRWLEEESKKPYGPDLPIDYVPPPPDCDAMCRGDLWLKDLLSQAQYDIDAKSCEMSWKRSEQQMDDLVEYFACKARAEADREARDAKAAREFLECMDDCLGEDLLDPDLRVPTQMPVPVGPGGGVAFY